jgi:hypothetical protein
MDWLKTLEEISTKYALGEKQVQTLGTETTLVLLGIISLDEYEETLKKELLLSVESPEKVIEEIKNSVLNTTQPEIKEVFENNIKPQTPEEEKIEQELDVRFKNLPEKIKNIINESNYQMRLYNIAKDYGLSVTQMGTLEIIFVDLVTGAIHSDKFEESVRNSLKLPDEKTHAIVNDVNEKILKEIREKLMSPSKIEDEEKDTDILRSAGIEIIPEKLEINSPSPTRSRPLENESTTITLGRPASDGTHPILTQKLSGVMKNPVVETDHSVENITKEEKTSGNRADVPKIDPYREIPE